LFESFGGSGYDIASAQHNTPILYQLINQKPTIKSIDFNPKFKEQLYFVYLNKKQNSREGIAKYRRFDQNKKSFIEEASTITDELIHCTDIKVFENLLERHEHLISSIISQKTVQESHFSDYFGQTKSLGAWGGDFIIATGNSDTSKYFKQKGFTTVISYEDMIL
jgi:mevalonate kinase